MCFSGAKTESVASSYDPRGIELTLASRSPLVTGMSPEWVETVDDDERFLPLIQEEASQICPYLWLGSEENARDLVWLKVNRITRVVTIMPRAIYPIECGQMSEALKAWFAENVETLFLKALDTPTELVRVHYFAS